MEEIIDKKYLEENPDHIFVFGDNVLRCGYGGAAKLRDLPNTYGFITKVFPWEANHASFTPVMYKNVLKIEMKRLEEEIKRNPDKTYLISKIGAGLANKHHIFEKMILSNLETLKKYSNVKFLWRI